VLAKLATSAELLTLSLISLKIRLLEARLCGGRFVFSALDFPYFFKFLKSFILKSIFRYFGFKMGIEYLKPAAQTTGNNKNKRRQQPDRWEWKKCGIGKKKVVGKAYGWGKGKGQIREPEYSYWDVAVTVSTSRDGSVETSCLLFLTRL
jgi:hypothetical protein